MAKRPVQQDFNLAERLFSVDDFGWWRIPDRNLAGGPGGRTISRIRLTYQIHAIIPRDFETDIANGALIMALTTTSGNPPPFPSHQPLMTGPASSIVYRELPFGTKNDLGVTNFYPAQGAVDAKGQRSIPADPSSIAVWFGVQAYDLSSIGSSNDILVFASGVVTELVPLTG